jgi:hypothetical protein
MASVLTQANFGRPAFGTVNIDTKRVAEALTVYLRQGSNIVGVSLDEISMSVTAKTATETPNLVELLAVGMKLFDAMVWLSAGRPATHPLIVDPTYTAASVPDMMTICRSVFYIYFFLLTQAHYPAWGPNDTASNTPSFLKNLMGMSDSQTVYTQRLFSFSPNKFDPRWVRYIKFDGFGQEALSRFGLGVAGYRMFAPFKLYEAGRELTEAQRAAFTFASTVAKNKATWAIHPVTRDPNILTSRGNLNKNLGNLMLEVFTDEQFDEMTKAKVLYGKPIKQPTVTNYKTWQDVDDISGTDYIFP